MLALVTRRENKMENLFKLNGNENIAEIEAKYEKIIMEPYHHVNVNKGKDFRKTLIEVYNYWLKLDETEIKLVVDFTQWLHTADLLVDDIQDSSELRRGYPAAHVIYGASRTIVAIDSSFYIYFLSEMSNQSTESVMIALNCAQNSVQGQAIEIYWRDNFICPSEEEYFDMISKKTGSLFSTITTYMQFYTKTKLNVNKLMHLFGMYFQIADDYRGLTSKFHSESKGFCDDIREGKFIFPVVHAINSHPNDTRILDILKMRTNDMDVRMNCLQLLEEFGSMEYTRNILNNFKNFIIQEIEQFGFNDNFKILFDIENNDQ